MKKLLEKHLEIGKTSVSGPEQNFKVGGLVKIPASSVIFSGMTGKIISIDKNEIELEFENGTRFSFDKSGLMPTEEKKILPSKTSKEKKSKQSFKPGDRIIDLKTGEKGEIIEILSEETAINIGAAIVQFGEEVRTKTFANMTLDKSKEKKLTIPEQKERNNYRYSDDKKGCPNCIFKNRDGTCQNLIKPIETKSTSGTMQEYGTVHNSNICDLYQRRYNAPDKYGVHRFAWYDSENIQYFAPHCLTLNLTLIQVSKDEWITGYDYVFHVGLKDSLKRKEIQLNQKNRVFHHCREEALKNLITEVKRNFEVILQPGTYPKKQTEEAQKAIDWLNSFVLPSWAFEKTPAASEPDQVPENNNLEIKEEILAETTDLIADEKPSFVGEDKLIMLTMQETKVKLGLKKVKEGIEEIGKGIEEIKVNGLHDAVGLSFEDYCPERLKISYKQAQDYIAFSKDINDIRLNSPIGETLLLPTAESQTRAIRNFEPEEKAKVYTTASIESGGKVPTAAKVQEVAERVKLKKDKPVQNAAAYKPFNQSDLIPGVQVAGEKVVQEITGPVKDIIEKPVPDLEKTIDRFKVGDRVVVQEKTCPKCHGTFSGKIIDIESQDYIVECKNCDYQILSLKNKVYGDSITRWEILRQIDNFKDWEFLSTPDLNDIFNIIDKRIDHVKSEKRENQALTQSETYIQSTILGLDEELPLITKRGG